MPEQPNDTSSCTRQLSRQLPPSPPYCSGISTFISEVSQARFRISRGTSPVSSKCPAFGTISLRVNSRAVWMRASWVSLRLRSMARARYHRTVSEPFGAWQLESLIAVGGLGEVWRAVRGDELAAVKRLHTHLARNTEARAQFAVEQRLARELPRHPNVIHGRHTGDVDGRPFVALDLIPGADLRRITAPPATRADAAPAAVALPRARALA